VLISADYSTAYKVKRIYNVYYELNQSRWLTENTRVPKFSKFITSALQDLVKKYDGMVYK